MLNYLILGPPETYKDFILSASLAMKTGDWRTSVSHVLSLKVCFRYYRCVCAVTS